MQRKDFRKSAKSLDEIITSFVKTENAFRIGGNLLKLTEEDVSLILGIPLAGKDLFPVGIISRSNLDEEYSVFLNKHFERDERINQKTLSKRIKTMIDKKIGDEDLIKLLLLLLVITFLFPNNSSYLQWGFIPKLLNLKNMNSISWAKAIHGHVSKNVEKFAKDPRSMPGCSMILLVCVITCQVTLEYLN